MTKEDIIQRLNALNFDKKEYWLIAGSAMVFYGLREQTNDIDLGCTPKLANQLEALSFPTEYLSDGTRKITCGQLVDNFPVISLHGLWEMKEYLGREKDYADIHLIKNYIEKNWQTI